MLFDRLLGSSATSLWNRTFFSKIDHILMYHTGEKAIVEMHIVMEEDLPLKVCTEITYNSMLSFVCIFFIGKVWHVIAHSSRLQRYIFHNNQHFSGHTWHLASSREEDQSARVCRQNVHPLRLRLWWRMRKRLIRQIVNIAGMIRISIHTIRPWIKDARMLYSCSIDFNSVNTSVRQGSSSDRKYLELAHK